jgi:hypothetical protein
MFDPSPDMNDEHYPDPVASTAASHRERSRPADDHTQIPMSSQATLVPTQKARPLPQPPSTPRQKPTPRLTREQARDAIVRSQASASPSMYQHPSVPAHSASAAATNVGETRSRSSSVELIHDIQDASGKGKGEKKKVTLGPLIEDSDHGEGDENEQIDNVNATTGTNNEEDEVDQLLEEEQSGTNDADMGDEEEDEPEDDAQIRNALENPGGLMDVDEEDEESESEDDLARLQKSALKTKAGPRRKSSTSTSAPAPRRYQPSPQVQPTRRTTALHDNPLTNKNSRTPLAPGTTSGKSSRAVGTARLESAGPRTRASVERTRRNESVPYELPGAHNRSPKAQTGA